MGQFKQPKKEVMVLGLGHSMILGHMPSKVPESEYEKVMLHYKSVESYGLFSSPDYNTFYPGVTTEDFTPQDEDFIEPVYRMLSEVIVNKDWNPVDFSMGGVLKASASKLIGQTVNCDHSTDIANAIGSVKNTYWQESFKDQGIMVPAGINGVLKIDAKANPRIARGILMNPPSIHSNSVSIQFRWEKSHPKLDDRDFWAKLGTYDEHGALIRKVCTDVEAYRETSLVSHGADPFAQKVKENGGINNPKYAGSQSYSEGRSDSVEYYFFDWKQTLNNKTTGNNNTMVFNMKENTNPKKEINMNDEELALLTALVGTGLLTLSAGKEVNKENVIEALKAVVASEASLKAENSRLQTEKETLESENADLKAKISGNESLIELGKAHLSNTRNTTTELYKKVAGEKVDENIVNLIASANLAQLESLSKGYQEKLDAMFPMKCSDCGSVHVTRGSAAADDPEDKGTEGKDSNESFGSILDNIAASKNRSTLFKKDK